jgi:hypothetical protein
VRAITTDIRVLVSRLGPVAVKALELAIGQTMRAGGVEVTVDHLLRAMLDLPDCDLSAAMTAANVARVDVAARLDWHLKRLPGGSKNKPAFSQRLLLLFQDAAALTTAQVRTGHLAAALLADPSLSSADIASLLEALPRDTLHLLASRFEDRGEAGRVAASPAPKAAEASAPPEASPPPAGVPDLAEIAVTPKAADAPAAPKAAEAPAAPKVEAAAEPPRGAAVSAAALRAHFGDRVVAAAEDGLTLSARVGKRETKLRIAWDTDARVLVLRIALPADPPKDEVSAAVALSTLNNALPHGAFVLDDGRLAFRSHVFLDADGNAPIETIAFAVRMCEEAADSLGAAG